MNEHQITCFLAAAEERSFSQAAKKLFLTQPAITYQISTLEKELEVKLFSRTASGVQLTSAGEAFLIPARSFRSAYLAAINSVSPYRESPKKLVIGCPRVMTAFDPLYHTLVTHLVDEFSQYQIEIRETDGGEKVLEELSGGVNCVIGLLPESVRTPQIDSLYLFQGQCYAAISKHHPLYEKTELTVDDLKGQIFYYGVSDELWIRHVKELLPALNSSDLIPTQSLTNHYPALSAGKIAFLLPRPYAGGIADKYLPFPLEKPLPPTMVTYLHSNRPSISGTVAHHIQKIYQEADFDSNDR